MGKTRVVFAERIHEAVGPREKYGPNPIVLSSAAITPPKVARKARGANFMMNEAKREPKSLLVRLIWASDSELLRGGWLY